MSVDWGNPFLYSFRTLDCMQVKAETLQSGVIGRKNKIVFYDQTDERDIWWWPCPWSEGLKACVARDPRKVHGMPTVRGKITAVVMPRPKDNGSVHWLLTWATLTLGTGPLPFPSSLIHHIMESKILPLNTCKTLMVFLARLLFHVRATQLYLKTSRNVRVRDSSTNSNNTTLAWASTTFLPTTPFTKSSFYNAQHIGI